MAWLKIGDIAFDADLVVFDKDGTLIEFEYAWGRQTVVGVEQLTTAVQGDDTLRMDLYRSLGYDIQSQRTMRTGPLATASLAKIYTIAAIVLYQHGFDWDEAEAVVESAFKGAMDAIPLKELVRPVTDVKDLVSALRRASVRIAVVTVDNRVATQETMALIDIEDQIDFLSCGDDPIALKPAPDAVLTACDQLSVEPARTLVVGDTVADMLMAENAGAGCRAGVLTGIGSRDSLIAHADVVLDSIARIRVSSAGRVT